jgi:hypothetical protein
MPLIKVPYDIKSNDELVRVCLEMKRYHVKHTYGIGPYSCCAHLEFRHLGKLFHVFGNSQLHMGVNVDIYTHDYIKCHGESSAVMAALNVLGNITDLSVIKRVYIEMSPCAARCAAFLNNLNPALDIYYSFDHPKEVSDWKKAAAALCK